MPIQAGSRVLASDVITATRDLIARGRRESTSTTTTSEVGVLRLDDIAITGGGAYRIMTSNLTLVSTVANDVVVVRIRYTTDGSTPTTSSTQMTAMQERVDNTSNQPIQPLIIDYYPSGDETLSLLLTVGRATGTGNVSIAASASVPLSLLVDYMGTDPGDTGTDI